MSIPFIPPTAGGRWIRRSNAVILVPGTGPQGELDELEMEAAGIQHPRLGYGRRLAPGASDSELEWETGGGGLVQHPRLGYGRRLPAGVADGELDELPSQDAGGRTQMEEEIIGTDDRVRVNPTTGVPYRWVCSLMLSFPDPAVPGGTLAFRGSGTLIGNRHILTCAHNLRDRMEGAAALSTVSSVTARPAHNLGANPFGTARSSRVRWAAGWNGSTATQDYGLITLSTPLGARTHASLGGQPLGFWSSPTHGGGTRIHPVGDDILRNAPLNVSGYPGDKCGALPARGSATGAQLGACPSSRWASTQWQSFGRVVSLAPAGLVLYDMDTKGGHSGSPVWLRWQGFRNLTAVHTGYSPPTGNRGVRLTDTVLKQVRAWMKADGENPTF
jgi:V8-like Glu-specific endopeptidase